MDTDTSLILFPTESEIESTVCICGRSVIDVEEDGQICGSCEQLFHRSCVGNSGGPRVGEPELAPSTSRDVGVGGLGDSAVDHVWMCDSCVHLLSDEIESFQGRPDGLMTFYNNSNISDMST